MMRHGFTLIELIVSLLIGALISISLTALLQQSYASQRKLEALTNLYGRASLIFTQLERDLMGATIPIENILALEDERKKKGGAKVKDGQKDTADKTKEPEKKDEQKGPQDSADAAKEGSKEPPYKPYERVFYAESRNNPSKLFFSWITHDPLQLYWGSTVGTARPRIARIMYRLEPHTDDKTVFKLIRSEGFDLSYAPYEKHTDAKYKGSVIAEDIKRIALTFFAVQEKKDKDASGGDDKKVPQAKAGEQKKVEKPPVMEVHTAEQWEWPRPKKEQAEKDAQKDIQELPPLPQGVRILLTLWDPATEREVTFESAVYIPSVPTLDRESGKGKKEPETKEPKEGAETKPGGMPSGSSPRPSPTIDTRSPVLGGIPTGRAPIVGQRGGLFDGIITDTSPKSFPWSMGGRNTFAGRGT